jgi:UDP-GlcNAc:undecaprenyl-phosphate GlcNAc-1-phosphate transferase
MYNSFSQIITVQSLLPGALMLCTAFILAVASYQLAKPLAFTFNMLDISNARKVHAVPTPRTGGVMVFVSFLALLPLSGLGVWWYTLSLTAMFTLGLWDDKTSVSPLYRLLGQTAISTFFVIVSGMYLADYGIFSIPAMVALPFTVFCIIGVTNSYNIIDGLNGLASGCAMIFLSMAAWIMYLNNDPVLFLGFLIMVGCLLGFMVFNFPRGRIFLGDGGSYFVGFTVITAAVFAVTRHGDISLWAFFIITIFPVFDTVLAIVRRVKAGRSPFEADKKHIHHVLLDRYRSGIKAVLVIWAIQLAVGLLAVVFHRQTYALIIIALMTVLVLYRLWLKPTRVAGFTI